MFSSEQWLANSGADFYNGVATQSLRFDDGSSANLIRSPSSAGDRQTWVWSGWVKRATIGSQKKIFLAYNNINNNENYFNLTFDNDDKLKVNQYFSNLRITTQVFRDASAWYHIVCAVDTHQATANNRILLYVNGEQITDFSTTDNYAVNAVTGVNHTGEHRVGGSVGDFDGYMAEVNFIDGLSFFSDTSGTANTSFNVNSFGETKNGVWIPIEYTGSYGTNGFRLQFDQVGVGTASTSTIGADTSGNTNHFTSSGIVASDCAMPDSPENNFCTWNPLDKDADYTLSEGNTKADSTVSGYGATKSTFAQTSGKWYWEITLTGTGVRSFIGIAKTTINPINATNGTTGTLFYQGQNGNIWYNGSDQGSYSSTYTENDIIGVALNLDDNEITFYKNNSSGGVAVTSIDDADWTPTVVDGSTGYITSFVANFGQDSSFAGNETAQGNTDGNGIGDFYYAPPSGFLALCTANLPEPTIGANSDTQADDHFNTVLFTGNGGTKAVTGLGFQPDWFWGKSRTNPSGVFSHSVYDSSRGVTKRLLPDLTNAESTTSGITSFDADGFTLGSNAGNNNNNATYVNWCWKANGGTTSSNTDGTITSTVQANTDAGFSIVTYTGTGANATVGHGLSSSPQMLITKDRDGTNSWFVQTLTTGGSDYLLLNATNATATDSTVWNSTSPSSTLFSLGSNSAANQSTRNFIAYCFHSVEGYSKIGSYTGNSNNDGTFVYTGFRPAMVMVKRTTGADSWFIYDIKRNSHNVMDKYLLADTSGAEGTDASPLGLDMVSNGFKWRINSGARNTTGQTYIYMAFADSVGAFKYANAR